MFQDLHLISGLSTLDNVLLAPFAAGVVQDRPRALALLDELGLADRAHRPAEALSRSQAQRAAIARAMLLRPKLILADEPTASLDDEACTRVAELLARAASETGAALLIATTTCGCAAGSRSRRMRSCWRERGPIMNQLKLVGAFVRRRPLT